MERLLPIADIRNCQVIRQFLGLTNPMLIDNPNIQDDDAQRLARDIADALDGNTDKPTMARKLLDMPYHALFDPNTSQHCA